MTSPRVRTRSCIEKLEHRALLTVQAVSVGTELFIVSDVGDTIAVRDDGGLTPMVEVVGNGVPLPSVTPTPAASLTKITIAGDSGNNVIDLSGITSASFSSSLEIIVDAGDGDDTITGSADIGATLNGNDGADQITGGDAGDLINGGSGMDVLSGGLGIDTINGGDGADVINGNEDGDFLNGNSGDDAVNGDDGDDVIDGGAGADTVQGGLGDDTLNGGSGNDTAFGNDGDDSLLGNVGNDSLEGGAGSDTLLGEDGRDSLFGQADNDSLNGGSGRDSLEGGDGEDTANGALGHDTVIGGDGDDTLFGGGGHDLIFGDDDTDPTQVGNDRIAGNSGDDSLFGGVGSDLITGNRGNDLIVTNDVSLGVGNVQVIEGMAGDVTSSMFTVTLSSDVPVPVTVDFSVTADGTLTGGTATLGTDVDVPVTSGTLTFLPGETAKNVQFTVFGDDVLEADETFFITLTNSTAVGISQAIGEGRIVNDDPSPPIDIFLALDDTGSFSDVADDIESQFDAIITTLQTRLPGTDLAFGVGRFEAYGGGGGFFGGNRPFILNQPIIDVDDPLRPDAISSALQRENTFGSGASREPAFEALFQIATGAGYDENGNGSLLDDGVAGPIANQVQANPVGDIAPYISFVPDPTPPPAGPVAPPTNPDLTADGVGFQPGHRKIVLLASDSPGFVFRDDGLTTYTGVAGATVPATVFAGGFFGGAIPVPNGREATIQATIDELIMDGIEVIGLSRLSPGLIPQLEAISTLTGAVNRSGAVVENNLNPGVIGPDDIQPGDPLYFEIIPSDPTALANSVADAIIASVAPPPPPPPPPPVAGVGVNDTLQGGLGNDTIVGAEGDDLIDGQAGDDSLNGGGGMDSIITGSGDDTIDAGTGDDDVSGGEGDNTLSGGGGDDTIVIEAFANNVNTAADTSGAETVIVRGTDGADSFTISQNEFDLLVVTTSTASVVMSESVSTVIIDAMNGDDTVTMDHTDRARPLALSIRLGEGNDTFDGRNRAAGLVPIQILGEGGNDTLTGTAGGDSIEAGDGDDVVFGQDGDDTVSGGFGQDTIDGDGGNDSVLGDAGNDSLIGDVGDDFLAGGDGNDHVNGMSGHDTLEGERGNDTLFAGGGNDVIRGGVGDDSLKGHGGDDVISGGGGNDRIFGASGADTIHGGDGDDFVESGRGDDLIAGGDGSDSINAGAGRDTALGGDSDDTLLGGGGADIVLGGDGDDLVRGNGSRDTVAGNEGDDDDLAGNSPGEINEAFTLSATLLAQLDALE